ncbi:MAG TPA: hypothetical protein VFD24_04595 [Chitinophagaceae bacterium]|jgi:hypothetical protein|nr:hypothetical protein [Chitinophagaceae bacterium]
MAINRNHEFEDLNGVKCAIVEKNASAERVAFLKELLEFNKYTVVVVASPPPKPAPAAAPKPQESAETTQPTAEAQAASPPPETFTLGVTNVTFNPTNAIFGRLLRTKDGHVVTLAYWNQQESTSRDEVPYYEAN